MLSTNENLIKIGPSIYFTFIRLVKDFVLILQTGIIFLFICVDYISWKENNIVKVNFKHQPEKLISNKVFLIVNIVNYLIIFCNTI